LVSGFQYVTIKLQQEDKQRKRVIRKGREKAEDKKDPNIESH